MSNIDLSVIIVNYNAKKLLTGCIQSIYENTSGINFEVIVVDNASRDGSCDTVAADFPQVGLIRNKENMGFGRANNLGLSNARGEHILFLNCDTKITGPSLPSMVAAARKKSDLGAMGVALYNSESDTEPQPCYGRFPSVWRLLRWCTFIGGIFPLAKDKAVPPRDGGLVKTDVVSGACLFVPRKVIEKVGIFDENFFMYFEEFDFCRRLKKAGYNVYFFPEVKIVHYRNQSASSSEFSGRKQKVLMGAALYYARKHHSPFAYFLFNALFQIEPFLNRTKKFIG